MDNVYNAGIYPRQVWRLWGGGKRAIFPGGGLLGAQQGGLAGAVLTDPRVGLPIHMASLPAFPGGNLIFIPGLCSYTEADPASWMAGAGFPPLCRGRTRVGPPSLEEVGNKLGDCGK